MIESNFHITESLINGLLPDSKVPKNAPFMSVLQNLRPTQYGAVSPETVTYPAGTPTMNHPFPQIFRGEKITLECDATTVSVVDESDWSKTTAFDGGVENTFDRTFGSGFTFPTSIAVNATHVFVGDELSLKVQRYLINGTYVDDFVTGYAPGGLFWDTANSKLYVTDKTNHLIKEYNSSGGLLNTWGSFGTGDGEFSLPQGILLYASELYITELGNDRVQVINLSGVYQRKWGGNGTSDGLFRDPSGIALLGTEIYVSDTINDRVQVFNSAGTFQRKFGTTGLGTTNLNLPQGVACDDAEVFVSDSNHSIKVFNATTGVWIRTLGSGGTGDSNFSMPQHLAIANTELYIADNGNDRVVVWDMEGATVSSGGVWHHASFQDVYFLTNGAVFVFDAPANPGGLVIADTGLTVQTLCNHRNRLVLGGLSGTFLTSQRFQSVFECWRDSPAAHLEKFAHDAMEISSNWVVWGNIAGGDVDIPFYQLLSMLGVYGEDHFDKIRPEIIRAIETGQIGMVPLKMPGSIYGVKVLGNRIIVYGELGIMELRPEEGGHGYVDIDVMDLGIAGRGAFHGISTQHVFVDSQRDLWVWFTHEDRPKRMGYSEYLTAGGGDLVISYDPAEHEYWVTDGAWSYILTRTGLGGPMDVKPTSLLRDDVYGLVGAAQGLDGNDDTIIATTHELDLGNRDSKHMTVVEAESNDITGMSIITQWKKQDTGVYVDGPSAPMNPQDVAFPRVSFVDGKVQLTGTVADGSEGKLHQLRCRYQAEGRRFRRGTSAAPEAL